MPPRRPVHLSKTFSIRAQLHLGLCGALNRRAVGWRHHTANGFGGRFIRWIAFIFRARLREIKLRFTWVTGRSTWNRILINLVAGALGGLGAGKSSPTFDLGTVGNVISGLVGGGVLGQIVTLLLPSIMAAAQSGNLSIGGIISQVISGGAGGAILTALIGAIKNKAVV